MTCWNYWRVDFEEKVTFGLFMRSSLRHSVANSGRMKSFFRFSVTFLAAC